MLGIQCMTRPGLGPDRRRSTRKHAENDEPERLAMARSRPSPVTKSHGLHSLSKRTNGEKPHGSQEFLTTGRARDIPVGPKARGIGSRKKESGRALERFNELNDPSYRPWTKAYRASRGFAMVPGEFANALADHVSRICCLC